MTIKQAYSLGWRNALAKFALGPPTQVDQFIADVDQAKDVVPEAALPPMSHAPGETLPALDGTIPLSTSSPTPPDIGSTVGTPPPPSMGALGG